MSLLNKIDKYFLEDPKRLSMGAKKIAERTDSTEDEVDTSRKKIKAIISASELIKELDSKGYEGNIRETAKTILNNPKESLDFQVDIVKRRAESKSKQSEDKYKQLLREYEKLDELYNDALRLDEQLNVYEIPKTEESTKNRQGASLIVYSDWHLGQMIDKKALNGLNEYNPEIAKTRTNKCFDSTLKLINRDVKDFDQHTTVVFLNGDFINGYIHPDSQRVTNSMTPIEEVIYAQELLTNGLDFLLQNAQTDKIVVACMNGNHARQEKRMESSIDHRTSYETMLYASLANKFKGDIDFVLPQSDVAYIDVLGKTIRYQHGHQVSYQGGIGGVTIPMTKYVQRQDTNKKADFNIFSHFHQLSLPIKNGMLNGSLVGMDNYCQTIGATGEQPLQAYRLLDSLYGFTSFNPIICQ